MQNGCSEIFSLTLSNCYLEQQLASVWKDLKPSISQNYYHLQK